MITVLRGLFLQKPVVALVAQSDSNEGMDLIDSSYAFAFPQDIVTEILGHALAAEGLSAFKRFCLVSKKVQVHLLENLGDRRDYSQFFPHFFSGCYPAVGAILGSMVRLPER